MLPWNQKMKEIGAPSLNIPLQGKHTSRLYSEAWNSTPKVSAIPPYLLVQELTGVLFNVALIQVCCQAHEANFRKAKVSELDVPHGCNQEAEEPERQRMELFPQFSKSANLTMCQFPCSGSYRAAVGSRAASARRQGPGRNKSSGFVNTALSTSNLLCARSPNPLLFAAFTAGFTGQVSAAEESLLPQSGQLFPVHAPHLAALNTLTQRHILWFHVQGGSYRVGWEKLQIRSSKELSFLSFHILHLSHFILSEGCSWSCFYPDSQISIFGPDF